MLARILLGLVFVAIWVVFLISAPQALVIAVASIIVGWQVGVWSAKLANFIFDSLDI